MIRYTLKCDEDHIFESWFQSAAAFDALKDAGLVSCAVCASNAVSKAVMAPRVRPARNAAAKDPDKACAGARADAGASPPPDNDTSDGSSPPAAGPGALSHPASPAEQALAEFRAKVEANSEDVGPEFAREARAIHKGDAPARAIIGQAKPAEAKSLIEDGIPVAPLPWGGRKTN